MGLLDHAVSKSPEFLYGVVKTELVKQALSHTDDQVRIFLLLLPKLHLQYTGCKWYLFFDNMIFCFPRLDLMHLPYYVKTTRHQNQSTNQNLDYLNTSFSGI